MIRVMCAVRLGGFVLDCVNLFVPVRSTTEVGRPSPARMRPERHSRPSNRRREAL